MIKFSIILPVRNGGNYVKECVTSILSQRYPDFNLIVLDNCSSDGTREWIESLSDDRIVLYKSDKILSIEENWARAVEVSSNEFITLIGHDDILFENFLSMISAMIQRFPDASLYQTHFSFIDSEGNKVRKCKPMPEKELPNEFLLHCLENKVDIMGTGLVMRSADYKKIGGIPAYPNLLFADFALWMSLTNLGYKVTSKQECYSFRVHQSTTSSSSDIIFFKAFERLVGYIKIISEENETFRKIVTSNAKGFLLYYCKGLTHRLIRTPLNNRNGLTVKKLVKAYRYYGKVLGVVTGFEPYHTFSIFFAYLIDTNVVSRYLFLGFKKLFPKPILK